jgi:hypothetical protein
MPPSEAVVTTVEVAPAPGPAADAPAAPAPTVSGFVETSYHSNFSDLSTQHPVPMRVYDPAGHSFALHAAHISISHKFNDNVLAVVDLDAGRDAAADTGTVYPWANKPQFAFDVQEAYASYTTGAWTLTAGKFVTYEGIEVIEGPLNPTITRGFLFGFAEPFTHTGLKLHFQPVDAFNIGLGVVNGWDQIADNNNMKTIIGRMAITPSDKFFVAISGTFGSEQDHNNDNHRVSADLTGAWTIGSAFQLWFQGNLGSEKNVTVADITKNATWWGLGLQPVVTASDFTLGGRLEYFADPQGARTGFVKGKFFNVTLTPGVKLGGTPFKLRGELRADIASDKIFGKKTDSKTQFTGALSAEYTF